MKSINKINDLAANAIIDPYLTFARTQPWFLTDDIYNNHFTNRYGKRDLIDAVLLPEQDCRCCYCMKRFNIHNDQDATIEHAIPRSTSHGNSFTDYFALNYPGLNNRNICHTQDYKDGINSQGQYPHHIAYHNYAIACHCCNNKRNNLIIGFPYFLPHNRQHISYNRATGKITWYDDPKLFDGSQESDLMVNVVGLNRPFLKAIRAVWLYGKDHPMENYSTPDTVSNEEERLELIYRSFGAALEADANFSTLDIEGFIALETQAGWNEVLKYDYFASI